ISRVLRMPNAVPRPAWTQAELMRPSFMDSPSRLSHALRRGGRLGRLGLPRIERDPDREARAFPRGRLDLDRPAMLLDDPVTDRKAQAGPLADRLGGEEWVEDALADGRFHAAAGVGDLDADASEFGIHAGAERHGLVGGAGVDGVHEQVDDDLVHPGGVAADGRQRALVGHYLDPGLPGVAVDHVHRRLDPGIEVDLVPLPFVHPGEETQVLDDPLDPPEALAGPLDDPGHILQAVVEVELLAEPGDLGIDPVAAGI